MTFDIVIGNPPYNNDLYLDFVTQGHKSAKQCSIWITPAKWQAKGGVKNDIFRSEIVPYMKEIVYYPDARDIFDIAEVDGISYYLIDKDIYTIKGIENKSKNIESFNNRINRRIDTQLNNIAYNLYTKISKVTPDTYKFRSSVSHFGFQAGDLLMYDGNIAIMSNGKIIGHCSIDDVTKNVEDIAKYNVMMNRMGGYCYFYNDGMVQGMNKPYILGKNIVAPFNYMCLYSSDNLNEIISFESFINTKLIKFLHMSSLVGTNIANDESWRFVPDPANWNLLYEDKPLPNYTPDPETGEYDAIHHDKDNNPVTIRHCSLYVKYHLTEDEINIFESVIKARK